MAKSPSKTVVGAFYAHIDGARTKWSFRRVTTRERIEMDTELREFERNQTLLVLGLNKAQMILNASIDGADLSEDDKAALSAYDEHKPTIEQVETLFSWFCRFIVNVEDLPGTPWLEMSDDDRVALVERFGLKRVDELIKHIKTQGDISELDLGKSENGSQQSTDQTEPGDEKSSQTSQDT